MHSCIVISQSDHRPMYLQIMEQVKQKVDDAFALRIGEKVIIIFNDEVKLCMDIYTRGGLRIANEVIETLSRSGTEADGLRVISAEIGTSSDAMLQ